MKKGFVTFGALFFVASSFMLSAGALVLAHEPESEPEPLPEPREYLREQCQQPDCDFILLDTIIDCESEWRMVKNSRSSAYGYFQILDSTEATTPQHKEGESKTDPYSNLDMGLYLYETRGSNPWNASRGCWAPKYYYKLGSPPPGCVGDCR